MEALAVLAEAAAAGIDLEPRGERLGITGPRDAVDRLRAAIVANKLELIALLAARKASGCMRCGEPVHRRSAEGTGWCCRDDNRRYVVDLAAAAGWPRLPLAPTILLTVAEGEVGWLEFAQFVAGATLYVAQRRLMERCGERVGGVLPSDSALPPWRA